jgi:PAS domain S-box-containing protein
MLDPDGYIKTWNAGGERIKGYARQEVVGTHFSRFYTPEDIANDAPQRGLDTAREEGRFSAEGWRLRKDGTRFFASVVLDPIWSDGELIGYAKVTRDITERLEAQRRLHEAQLSLFQAQKMEAIGKLTLGLAHDFNNLLGVVITGLDLVADHVQADAKLTKYLDSALRAAERGSLLTRQLLTFGRGQNLTPQRTDINQLIHDSYELFMRSCPENCQIQLSLQADLPAVDVDRPQLEAAILNLIVNSRDAMPKGGTVTITTSTQRLSEPSAVGAPDRNMVRISVMDEGEGIPLNMQERVFEPFFTTKAIGKGSGLGLSQVFGFALQSGGHSRLTSTPGHGTTVEIFLPVPE